MSQQTITADVFSTVDDYVPPATANLFGDSALLPEPLMVSETIIDGNASRSHSRPRDETPSEQRVDSRPWYKRPSPYWVYPIVLLSASLFSSTAAPRNEVLINLACAVHRPEYYSTPVIPKSMPSADRRCSSDPVVLAEVAKLVTVQSMTLGILTCLTVGWWGQLSDRRGRKLVLAISIVGILLGEICIVLVARNPTKVPGGYWFLVLPSAVDGALGGLSTASATLHAYLADCVDPHARSRTFSLYLGFLFSGIAIGPTMGSLIIHLTKDILTPYFIAIVCHIALTLMWFFIVPESLTMEARLNLARKRLEARKKKGEDVRQAKAAGRWGSADRLADAFSFLAPLAMFLPKKIPGTSRRDWSLTLLVFANTIMFSFMSLIQYKTQYAIATFGWRSEELGYFLSAAGISRAFNLVLVLPIVMRYVKPQPSSARSDTEPDESAPLLNQNSPQDSATRRSGKAARAAAHGDLLIARGSLLIDIVCFLVLTLSTGPKMYIAGSLASSFADGFGPSASSLAMYLAGSQESGKLFGAMAVLTSTGASIVGPAVFGAIWLNTVATFPKAIFVAATSAVCIVFIAVMLIRLPEDTAGKGQDDEGLDSR